MNTLNGYSKSTLTDLYALTAAGGHFPIHSGRNNEANKLVRTDASGYLNAGWINTTSGNFTGTPSRIYASNDAYIRYMTPANFFPTLTNTDNLLDITIGGLNRKLTVAYATSAGSATYIPISSGLTTETNITESGLRAYSGSGAGWTGTVTSMAYAGIITLGTPSRGFQLWARRGTGNTGSLHFRVGNNDANAWETDRVLLDNINWTSYISIPTVTNYYWADQKISSSSNAATSPTVALLKATTGVQIGSTADIGWYLSNSRISAGSGTARGVNVGSLLVSNAWADYTKVPTNGIYSKGAITTSNFIKLLGTSAEAAHILFTRTNYNYITFPDGYSLAFGISTGSANTMFRMDKNSFFPERTNEKSLGTSSLRWSNIYSTLGNFSSTVTGAGTIQANRFYLRYAGTTGVYADLLINTRGTTSAGGVTYLLLGNSTATGTAENALGILRIYGSSSGYTDIRTGTNNGSGYTLYLPGDSGLFVYHTNDTAVGNATTPVYVTAGGKITACTSYTSALDGRYVKKAGDTMTGRLTMTGEGIIVTTATSSNYRIGVEFYKGTSGDATYSYDAQIGWHNTGGDGTGSICILPYATSTQPWGGSVGLFITKTDLKYNNNKVLHTGNSSVSGGGSSVGSSITVNIGGTSKTLTIPSNASTASKVYINNSSGNNAYPVVFTNTASCGTPRNDSLYVDTASGAGYNPSTNAFVASVMTAGTHNSTSTLYLDSGTATTSIIFRIGGTEKVRIALPNGYLGINTTTITYPLTVNGTAQVSLLIVSTANLYRDAGGIILNNSDIWKVNAIYTADDASNGSEGYQFMRTNGNYDSIWCHAGAFYFSPDGNPTDGYSTNYTVLHSGNSSVSGGGSSWGSSITVKINGTSKTLTIPNNPNTDSLVQQSKTTSGNMRPILMGYTQASNVADLETDVTNKSYVSSKIYAVPSTGTLYAKTFSGNLAWGNITGKPSTFTPSSHTHSYLPLSNSSTPQVQCNQTGVVNFRSDSDNEVGVRLYLGATNKGGLWANSSQTYMYNTNSGYSLGIKDNGTPFFRSYTLYHTGNLSIPSYSTKSFSVNGTGYNIYTSSSSLPTIYAPTSAGTSGYILQSSGGTPTWTARQDYSNPGILWVGYIYRTSRTSTYYYASKSGGKASFSLTSSPNSSYEYLSGTLSGYTSIMAAFVLTQAVFSDSTTTCYAYSAINFGKAQEAGFDTYRVSISGSTIYIRACRMTDSNNASWEDDGFLATGSGHDSDARPVARIYLMIIGY